jgi:hypothetical protein
MANDFIKNLDSDTMLQLLKNEIGFKFEMPDILTFCDDDYYMGKILYDKYKGKSRVYPYWREVLQELYPNNLTTKSSYLVLSGCIGCLTGDTKIDTLRGTKTFKEILEDWNSGDRGIYVMSANPEKSKIEYDKVIDVFPSGNKKVYEITLDNGESFKCTSNHLFLTNNNEWASIDNGLLQEGLSLLPFNHRIKKGYYEFYDPYKGVWRKRYRVPHIDYNKSNDNSDRKVISIKECGYEDVYDLTTEKNHNFALYCGIFAHNSGKSTISQIICAYDYLKLQAMIDPGSYFELINQNGIALFNFSIYKYKAKDFTIAIKKWLQAMPAIQDMKKKSTFNPEIKILPGYSKKSIVSTDACTIQLSEVNEYKNPDDILSSALSRMESRFRKGLGMFCHAILDCSAVSVNSPTERFIHESPYSNKLMAIEASIWDVKPQLFWGMEPKSFTVYGGDSVVNPHIIEEGEDTSTYDQDRILEVPSELREQYESDILKALNETAGLSLISGGMFYPDDYIKQRFNIPQVTPDTISFDFYDETQIFDIEGIEDAVDLLPEDRYMFVGLDCGYATDHYGVAIGYSDSTSKVKLSDDDYIENYHIKIPICIGFGRKKNQQTNITKIRNFLLELNKRRPIYMVAYDGHQTVQLAQDMKFNNIKTKLLSVEKDKYPLALKHALCEGLVDLPDNEVLYREFRCLKHRDGYIDHSSHEGVGKDGEAKKSINSKDMVDAVTRCFAIIRSNINVTLDVPKENVDYYSNIWQSALAQTEYSRLERENMLRYARMAGGSR